ncbi:MAG: tRNA preQ1(34) S-adenosylmethionine ribosyltransferase-isomerase QueA [Sulfurovaceae bacterium]|nr:tRNA preQ1(34) S-adenosylmethionine ribosyltransferase-isomerase QueA [Sulfurovaceae bacterium]MDD5548570.1 tRNA preQ1(34) S-adenosylmethionine ribosyltransferase-isomerase QueA [Sulfurovaceae bacterium]
MNLDLLTSSYDYMLPKELIASHPAHPADSAKLLVYDRASDTITHSLFSKILDFIPQDCSIFLNDTKVIKARIFGNKSSGGKIELLLDKPIGNNQFVAYIRGKVNIGTILYFENYLKAKIINLNDDGSRIVEFFENDKKIDFAKLIILLDNFGHVPLPPYIQRSDTKEDVIEYQSLFAKVEGAVAAPTASLHFTPELLDKLKDKFDTYTLTLHVGSGTFKPVDCNHIKEHQIHSELFDIPLDTASILQSDKPILAVGTTVTRTIEYFHQTGKTTGECDIFLHPQNTPKRVNHLLTNFHLPKSTLIMLVSSFIGREKTLEIYKEAIENKYRFYSYGDAILIL